MANRTKFITSIKKSKDEILSQKIEVAILCASIPFGMINYGPKSILSYNKSTVIENQIKIVRNCIPNADIIICGGFQLNKLKEYIPENCRIVENQLYDEALEAEQIRLVINNCLTKNLLIIMPDIIFTEEVIDKVIEENKSCIVYNDSLPKDEIGIINKDGYVLNFSYSFAKKWSYIAYFKDNEFDLLKNSVQITTRKKWMSFECIKDTIKSGAKYKPVYGNVNRIYSYKDQT